MKLHLKKTDDGKGTGLLFQTKGVQGPIRERPDFREAKHAYRRLYEEHVECTRQGNKSIHPAQQRRQTSQQQFDEHEEVRLYGSPSNWMEILSSNKFVFILAVAAEQWMDVESKLGLLAIFNLDWTVKFFMSKSSA